MLIQYNVNMKLWTGKIFFQIAASLQTGTWELTLVAALVVSTILDRHFRVKT